MKPFLLAMYPILKSYENSKASFELLKVIITDSLKQTPRDIDTNWLKITQPPHDNGLLRKFTAPDIKQMQSDLNSNSNLDGMDFTYSVLKFQISELHKMENKQLKDPVRYFGVTSETEHDWYNFTALSVLECGLACTIDNKDNLENMDWSIIGKLLEDGRIYE